MNKISLYEIIANNHKELNLSVTFIDATLDLFEDIVT